MSKDLSTNDPIRDALARLAGGEDLSVDEMSASMRQIMTGEADDAQIGAFLMALRIKGETLDEITGAVTVMRELVTGVTVDGEHVVDIVGTGGDGANLFNVSTASAIVTAAAGARVAKHGNRSVSSKSGSADLLEAAGVRLDIGPEQVARCVEQLGVGFMFAPMHHSAMRHAIGPRKALGLRTIFNILGPMTNPAGVKRMVIGVFDEALCRPVAEVLGRLGGEHIMVVHSLDGLDEISLATPTQVAEFKHGALTEYRIDPSSLGIEAQSLDGLEVDDAAQSLALIQAALSAGDSNSAAEDGHIDGDVSAKAADIIALNAGAAIYVSGLVPDLASGVGRAQTVIRDGSAAARLQQLAELSQVV